MNKKWLQFRFSRFLLLAAMAFLSGCSLTNLPAARVPNIQFSSPPCILAPPGSGVANAEVGLVFIDPDGKMTRCQGVKLLEGGVVISIEFYQELIRRGLMRVPPAAMKREGEGNGLER